MALGGYKVFESCETGMQSYSCLPTSLEQGSHFSCITGYYIMIFFAFD